MNKHLRLLWKDEHAFIISTELILIATILILGMVVGLQTIRDTITTEMADVAAGIGTLNQSYILGGLTGHNASVAGSTFVDFVDFCDNVASNTAGGQQCVGIIPGPTFEQ